MTLKSSCKDIEMNSSLNSSNSDDFIDELNWTSDFATPGWNIYLFHGPAAACLVFMLIVIW